MASAVIVEPMMRLLLVGVPPFSAQFPPVLARRLLTAQSGSQLDSKCCIAANSADDPEPSLGARGALDSGPGPRGLKEFKRKPDTSETNKG